MEGATSSGVEGGDSGGSGGVGSGGVFSRFTVSLESRFSVVFGVGAFGV